MNFFNGTSVYLPGNKVDALDGTRLNMTNMTAETAGVFYQGKNFIPVVALMCASILLFFSVSRYGHSCCLRLARRLAM